MDALIASTSAQPSSPPSAAEPKLSSDLPLRPVRTSDYRASIDEDDLEDSSDGAALLTPRPGKHRARSDSIASLAFDFNDRILFASSAEVGLGAKRKGPPSEPISHLGGVALIVGMQIGSGIFSSPGVVAKETGSVGSALLLWTGAGLLSWAGASSFAELGTSLPMNGGSQAYLQAAYGSFPAYCFSFTSVVALRPGSQAIISVIAGEYLSRIFFHTAFSSDPNVAAHSVPIVAIKATAMVILLSVSALHAWSAKAGTNAQVVLTVFKVLAIVLVFIGGLVFLGLGRAASTFGFEGATDQPAGYALALFSALWTFDGWDQCNYVAQDCKPGTLPTIIHSSMGTVVILFLCANISYFLVLPFTVATATSTIGLDFGRAIAGPIGGVIFALIVSVSCIGALNGGIYTGSRLIVAASEQDFLPKLFSRYNERRETPMNAILLSAALSCVFILFGDFQHLTLFYGVAAWTWMLLVVVGLLVLRVREPQLKRPYRTFLATPILFACTALFLIVLSCFSKPWESLAAFLFNIAGCVPFYLQKRRQALEEKGGARETMELS